MTGSKYSSVPPPHGLTADQIIDLWHRNWALSRIHLEYRKECEALGYDVEGNRRAVLESLGPKLDDPNIPLSRPSFSKRGAPEDQDGGRNRPKAKRKTA